jgi:hypothetical protein
VGLYATFLVQPFGLFPHCIVTSHPSALGGRGGEREGGGVKEGEIQNVYANVKTSRKMRTTGECGPLCMAMARRG